MRNCDGRRLRGEKLECRYLLASADPVGEQFEVAQFQTGKTQFRPDVAMADDGRYVTVWEHWFAGDDIDVRMQRFDRNHDRVGSDSVVANSGARNEEEPSVAIAPDGSKYVVVWENHTPSGANVSRNIWFALYEWDGTKIVDGQVNTTEGAENPNDIDFEVDQTQPDVAMASDGSFVVVWRHRTGENSGIRFRSYDATGTPHKDTDQEVLTGSSSWDIEDHPTVAMTSFATFVAAWEEKDFRDDADNPDPEIAWAVYDFDFGDELFEWKNGASDSFGQDGEDYRQPSIAARSDSFILAFEGDVPDGQSRFDAYYGVYDLDGAPIQAPQRISGLEGVPGQGLQYLRDVSNVSVDASDDGGYVIAWHGEYDAVDDSDLHDVYYRQYDAFGNVITQADNPYNDRWDRVNSRVPERQRFASVAKSNGSFVIAFIDYPTSSNSGVNVMARAYNAPDDFRNDATTTAVGLPGVLISGEIDYVDDRDAFRFSAVEDTYYIFEALSQSDDASLTLALVGTGGDVDEDLIDFDTGTGLSPRRIPWRAPSTDTYFFGVTSDDLVDYEVSFEVVSGMVVNEFPAPNTVELPQFDTSLGELRGVIATAVLLAGSVAEGSFGQEIFPHQLFVSVGPFSLVTLAVPLGGNPFPVPHIHQIVPTGTVSRFTGAALSDFEAGRQSWNLSTQIFTDTVANHSHAVSLLRFQVVTEFLFDPPEPPQLRGDFNGSGRVEQGDLDLVLLHWGEDGTPPPQGWVNDLPEGAIDQDELDAVLLNWGESAPAALATAALSLIEEGHPNDIIEQPRGPLRRSLGQADDDAIASELLAESRVSRYADMRRSFDPGRGGVENEKSLQHPVRKGTNLDVLSSDRLSNTILPSLLR